MAGQTANIAKAVQTLWRANDSLPALVPGGLIWGAVKQETTRPYASLKVTTRPTQRYSGPAVLEQYLVTVSVYAKQMVATAGEIQKAMADLILQQAALQLDDDCLPLVVLRSSEPIDEDQERYQEQNVLIARAQWRVSVREPIPQQTV